MTDIQTRVTEQLLRATASRFEAQRQEALAVLDVFLTNNVGVGDHPNIVAEIATAISSLAAAEEALGTMQRNFFTPTKDETNDE